MKVNPEGYQTHWHADEISGNIAGNPDTAFIFYAWDRLVQLSAAEGKPGRVIDIACGNARDVTKLSQMGWDAIGMDPSLQQLKDAREATREAGEQVHLVRGVAEFLPFREDVFNSLICKSALDHFVDRDQAMSECSRVLVPEGRAVVSANNYGGLTVQRAAGSAIALCVRSGRPHGKSSSSGTALSPGSTPTNARSRTRATSASHTSTSWSSTACRSCGEWLAGAASYACCH